MSGFQVGFLNRGRGGNVKRKRRKKKRPASKGCSGETKEALIVSSGANITTSKESTTSVEPAPTAYDYYSKEKMPEILEMGYSMEEAEVKLSDQWSNLPGQTIKHYHEVSRKGLLNFKKEEIKKLNDQIHTARNKSKELMSVKKQLEAQADRLKGEYIQVTQKNNHTTGLYNEAYRMMKDQKMHCQNEIALVRSEVLEMQKALKAAKIAGVKKKEKQLSPMVHLYLKNHQKRKVPLPPKQKKYKRTIYFQCLVKKHRRQKKRSPIHRTVLLLRRRPLLRRRRRRRRLLGLS